MSRRRLSIALGLLLVFIVQSAAFAQDGTLWWGEITSPALEGNLIGDPATRSFAVYLPPSYETSEKCRYPVFYMLHGYDQQVGTFTSMRHTIDRMIGDGDIGEMIAVFVDGSNKFRGSWYLSSVTIGDYETYIARDLVNYVDANHRTIPHRNSRGITGASMGGYGAMHLALKFPDVFAAVVAQAGVYDWDADHEKGLAAGTALVNPKDWTDLGELPWITLAWFARAAAAAPNPDSPPFFLDRPYEVVDREAQVVPEVWQRIVEQDVMHDVDRYLDQRVRLNGIKIVHGRADWLLPVEEQGQALHEKLTDLGVDHVYVEHSGGHVFLDEESLGFLSDYLLFVPEETPKVVSTTTTLGATWVGQATPLEIAVELDAPLETSELLRRLILDLSPLGIPSHLPLEHVGDGRYTLSTTITPPQNGRYYLPILVETTEGEQYAFLSVSLVVYPGGDDYLYQDQVGPRWEVKVVSAELDLKASDIVHQGSYAQAINLQGGYIRYTFKDPDGFSTFGYTALEFWINPGTLSMEGLKLYRITAPFVGKYWRLKDDLGITLEPNVWQVVSIPLEDLKLVDTHLKYIQLRGVEGTFYIDDLAFVVAEYRLKEVVATPERVKSDGTMPTTLTVQAVPAVPQPGPLPTVTVDLSPIGGEEDAVMVDDGTGEDKVAGDGIHTIQTTVDPETQNGLKDLVITSTDSRLRVARTYLPLAVLPAEDMYLYQDQVEAGWELELYKAETNPNSTEYVHSGSCAHAITLQTGGNIQYTFEDPDGLPTFGYGTLDFWLNPGTASTEELKIVAYRRVAGALKTKLLSLVEQLGLSFEPETWQQVSIPIETLELTDVNLERIRFVGDVQGTFYIDDMRLVPDEVEITAVEEVSEATALPLGYALSQNYPNPFNARTTIAFDLPSSSKVKLSVYNIISQRVRTLVSGVREPGHHFVVWDGKNEEGRDVASGVYLYRMQAGDFVAVRKGLLLR